MSRRLILKRGRWYEEHIRPPVQNGNPLEIACNIDLPADIWIMILRYIHYRKVLPMSKVCKKWQRWIIQAVDYFSFYGGSRQSAKILIDTTTKFPNLTCIKITGLKFDSTHLIAAKKLTHLILQDISLDDYHIKGLTTLQTLEVHNSTSDTKNTQKHCLANSFRILKDLPVSKLVLYNKHSHCNTCIPLYAQLTNLRELHIINGDGFNYRAIQTMLQNTNLRVLNLHNTEVCEVPATWHLTDVNGLFPVQPTLQKLVITNDKFDKDAKKGEFLRTRLKSSGVDVEITNPQKIHKAA